MKHLITLLFALCALRGEAQELSGRILNENGQPIVIGVLLVKQNGVLKDAACSDYDGYYTVKPLAQGFYDVTAFYGCYDTLTTTKVWVANGGTTTLNLNLTQSPAAPKHIMQPYKRLMTALLPPEEETKLKAITVSQMRYPQGRFGRINIGGCGKLVYAIDGIKAIPIQPIPDNLGPTCYYRGLGLVNLTPKELATIPATELRDIVALAPRAYQRQRGADVNIGGAGSYGTLYVIDGMQIARW